MPAKDLAPRAHTRAAQPRAQDRARFVVTLEAAPDRDAIRELRWLLKYLGRHRGLRCVSAIEVNPP
jgi:hypothetical protein